MNKIIKRFLLLTAVIFCFISGGIFQNNSIHKPVSYTHQEIISDNNIIDFPALAAQENGIILLSKIFINPRIVIMTNKNGGINGFKKGHIPHNKGRGEFKICPGCQKEFWVHNYILKLDKGKYCSDKCYRVNYKHSTETLEKMSLAKKGKPSNSPTKFVKGFTPWNKGRGEFKNCPVCDKEYWVENNLLKNGRGKFCSRECSTKGKVYKSCFIKGHRDLVPAESRGHSDETKVKLKIAQNKRFEDPAQKEKLSIAGKKRMKDPIQREKIRLMGIRSRKSQGSKKPTLIETIVYNNLKDMNVAFEPQKVIGDKFVADVYIPHLNLIIECDGDYWHNLEKTIEKDIRKNKYLRDRGYSLIRIWEHEIKSKDFPQKLASLLNGVII